MANEATLFWEVELPIPFTVANGVGIEKGTLLKLTDPMTAAAADGAADVLAGIAAEEKIASDGKTKLGVYRRGIFKMTSDGSISVGASVMSDGTSNQVITATTATSGAKTLGTSLETAADGDTFLVDLNIGSGSPNS
jgi:hypothetical protein